MAKRTLREAYIYAGVTYGPGEAELPKEADEALRAKGAFGDEPTTAETMIADARADAVDMDSKVQQEGERASAGTRQEVIVEAAKQAQANAAALTRAAKGGK